MFDPPFYSGKSIVNQDLIGISIEASVFRLGFLPAAAGKIFLDSTEVMFDIENKVFYRERNPTPCLKMMKADFKGVPALYKCFDILEFLAKEKKPLGISEISRALNLNKSTVFNIAYTLTNLGVLENSDNRFRFGPKLYVLGKAAEKGSELIRAVHPYLEEISKKTNLSAIFGMRAGLKAIILDKVDSSCDLKISSEIGISVPLLAGAGGKALLSQLPDAEIDEILSKNKLRGFTRFSSVDKKKFTEMIAKVRKEGIAIDKEEYIEGIRALAVPIIIENRKDLQVAVWAVGLKSQIKDTVIASYSSLLKESANKIEMQFSF